MARDFYAVLAVAKTATDDQIRLRFRQLARERHPDRFAGEEKQAAELAFQEITQAFNVLCDPELRRQHDMDLARRQEAPSDPKQVARIYLQRGVRAYREKNLVEAADNFDRATRADPTSAQAWFNLALTCSQNQVWMARAAVAIDRACELEPMNPGYWKVAGRILALAGHSERAAAAYRKAIDWGEDDPAVQQALEELSPLPAARYLREAQLMLRIKSCGLSDVGLTRVHNEDYFEIDPRHRLYVVADGMGGHSAGEVAAQIAVKAIHDFIEKSVDRDATWSLRRSQAQPLAPFPDLPPAPAPAGAPPMEPPSPSGSGAADPGAPGRPAADPAVAATAAAARVETAANLATPVAVRASDERLARHSRLLKMAVRKAHDNVLTAISKDGSLHGMGTTVVGLLLSGPTAAVAHVGDSRAYRLRHGRLDQLTQDHTWVHEQVVAGLLSQEQARSHPLKNVVTRALGGESEVVVDVREVPVQPGDIFLLCSDGLTGMLSDADIRERLGSGRGLHEICRSLVNEANARGGLDNVTVVLLSIEDGDDEDGEPAGRY